MENPYFIVQINTQFGLPSTKPLTKELEDSGNEITIYITRPMQSKLPFPLTPTSHEEKKAEW